MNTLGHLFRIHSWGESHGDAVGCVVDGCPAGLPIDADAIQHQVNRRRTGLQDYASARQEDDRVEILSGVFEGKSLGSPICILIRNGDARPGDYLQLQEVFRPGHADYAYAVKYGHRDYRGGGRSSVRITAPLVAAGALAQQYLHHCIPGFKLIAYVSRIGQTAMNDPYRAVFSDPDEHAFRCPDVSCHPMMQKEMAEVAEQGDTLGGEIVCRVQGLPAGLGEPVFGKLQAQLAHAMMSIPSVKAFEYGEGFAASCLRGSIHNDAFSAEGGRVKPAGNHHGGILGGISTGEELRFRVGFKPISSIRRPQQTVNTAGENLTMAIGGRHDVCAVPRAVPIVEAYAAIILADAYLHQKLSQ